MDHWFDSLTRRLASGGASRRDFLTAGGAAFAALAAAAGWPALATKAPTNGAAAGAKDAVRKGPSAITASYGPCTMTANGLHSLEHRRVSTATAAGITAVWQATRTHDAKGLTLDHTLSFNGKKQLQITVSQAPPASSGKTAKQAARTKPASPKPVSMQITIGDGFGYKGASLTSSDGGKTLQGTVDGRAIHPFIKSPGKKPQFIDGKGLNAQLPPGFHDALQALFAQSKKDVELCTQAASRASDPTAAEWSGRPELEEAPHVERVRYGGPPGGANSKPISSLTYKAMFSPACVACANNCCVSMLTVGYDTVMCVAGIFTLDFSTCDDLAGLSTQQTQCLDGCDYLAACHGQLCIGASLPPYAVGLPSCAHGQICLGLTGGSGAGTGYCCPDGYPNPCPGVFNDDPTYMDPINSVLGSNDYANVCCAATTTCLGMPEWWYQLAVYYRGYQCNKFDPVTLAPECSDYWGPESKLSPPDIPWQTCCPTAQLCAIYGEGNQTNYNFGTAYYKGGWSGMCCPPNYVCAKSLDPPADTRADTGAPRPTVTSYGHPTCCLPKDVKKGNCCTKQWCDDGCCEKGESCQNSKCCAGEWCGQKCCRKDQNEKCVNGECRSTLPCLSGQLTVDDKCCAEGQTACGKQCCAGACADAATSTCGKAPPKPKTPKCKIGQFVCSSQLSGSGEIKEICCPEGGSCFNGKCCPRSKAACTNAKTGEFGCWAPSQCQAAPK